SAKDRGGAIWAVVVAHHPLPAQVVGEELRRGARRSHRADTATSCRHAFTLHSLETGNGLAALLEQRPKLFESDGPLVLTWRAIGRSKPIFIANRICENGGMVLPKLPPFADALVVAA